MKGEGQFNTFLSKEFKRALPEVFSVKLADKYKTGLSDFIIWVDKTSVALECKSISSIPEEAKALDHPFSPTQLNFFRRFTDTGCLAYGLVAVNDLREMILFPAQPLIALKGNLRKEDFSKYGTPFPLSPEGVRKMIDYFRGEFYGGQ